MTIFFATSGGISVRPRSRYSKLPLHHPLVARVRVFFGDSTRQPRVPVIPTPSTTIRVPVQQSRCLGNLLLDASWWPRAATSSRGCRGS